MTEILPIRRKTLPNQSILDDDEIVKSSQRRTTTMTMTKKLIGKFSFIRKAQLGLCLRWVKGLLFNHYCKKMLARTIASTWVRRPDFTGVKYHTFTANLFLNAMFAMVISFDLAYCCIHWSIKFLFLGRIRYNKQRDHWGAKGVTTTVVVLIPRLVSTGIAGFQRKNFCPQWLVEKRTM